MGVDMIAPIKMGLDVIRTQSQPSTAFSRLTPRVNTHCWFEVYAAL